ncbi:MAG: hypothetical protein JWN22_3639 [Nocardioides sp.]|jgi:hypothetical protein|nr:hypothetical protein [Nocardioides sp.]
MRRAVQWLLVGAIVLDVAYWSVWFTDRDVLASEHRSAYYEFENAFPLADLWLGVACLLALVALRAGRPVALFWLIAAGSSGLYLFGMDFLYDLEHGIFAKGGGGVAEACIVAVTLVFSLVVLRFAWTRREELLHPLT